jgi:uncharacterized protein (TIGR02284 family)
MATDNDSVISTLNNLIETCKDGENGFRTAADGVKNSELKTLFLTYSQQRAQFAAELQAEVRLHRGWINIKSTVTGEDEGAVISECERGEDSAAKNYKEALNENLPANLQSIVQQQFTAVKEAHDRIRALEKATSAGA